MSWRLPRAQGPQNRWFEWHQSCSSLYWNTSVCDHTKADLKWWTGKHHGFDLLSIILCWRLCSFGSTSVSSIKAELATTRSRCTLSFLGPHKSWSTFLPCSDVTQEAVALESEMNEEATGKPQPHGMFSRARWQTCCRLLPAYHFRNGIEGTSGVATTETDMRLRPWAQRGGPDQGHGPRHGDPAHEYSTAPGQWWRRQARE